MSNRPAPTLTAPGLKTPVLSGEPIVAIANLRSAAADAIAEIEAEVGR